MRLSILGALALAACDTGTGTDSGGSTDSGDTDSDSGIDSGDTAADTGDTDTGDTADTADTADTGTPTTTLGFDLHGDYAGSRIELRWLDPVSIGLDPLVFGDAFLDAAAPTQHVDIIAPTPDASLLFEIDPVDSPGMFLAIFVPSLYQDVGGDGAHDGDDPYLGVGLEWPVFLTGDISAAASFIGLVEGWNTMAFGADGSIAVGDIAAIPLPASLAPINEVTLSGTYAGDTEGMFLLLASGQLFDGTGLPAMLLDQPLEATWSLTLSSEPAPDRIWEPAIIGAVAAIEVPYTYLDENGDGAWDPNDTRQNAACSGTTPVAMLWRPAPTELAQATSMLFASGTVGWSAILLDAEATPIDEAARTSLQITPECVQGPF